MLMDTALGANNFHVHTIAISLHSLLQLIKDTCLNMQALCSTTSQCHGQSLKQACSCVSLLLADTVPAVMAAMLQHELLPFLSDDSARDKVHAIARVHQMAVCLVSPTCLLQAP